MINRREFLLGGLSLGTLGLTGCGIVANLGPTGGRKRIEPHTKASVYRGFTSGVPTHLYYDETTLAFFMPYGEHFVATGDFNYYQLPDSLWRKAYFDAGIMDITATYHEKTNKDVYEIKASDKSFDLIFIDNELNKQEKKLLQQLFSDKIQSKTGDDYRSGWFKALSKKAALWEIRIELPSLQLYGGERMVHLFDKENDFQIVSANYHFYQSAGERYNTWLANNPSPLLYQADGSLLYHGKRLTKRLDKLVKMARNRLEKPF